MKDEPDDPNAVAQRPKSHADPDPWRYRCPNGHTAWRALATADEYECKSCGARFSRAEMLDLRSDANAADFGEKR